MLFMYHVEHETHACSGSSMCFNGVLNATTMQSVRLTDTDAFVQRA